MKFNPLKWIFIVILMMMSGCKPTLSPVIADTTCEAPCWRNIFPGETTKEELIELLNQMDDLTTEGVYIRNNRWKIFDDIVEFTLLTGEEAEVFILQNQVAIMLFHKKKIATFDKALVEFGEPVYILNHRLIGPGILEFGDTFHENIIALYPQKGIVFSHDTFYELIFQRDKLRPDSDLQFVYYFDPDEFEILMEEEMLTWSMLSRENAIERFIPWDGYGVIDEKYPFQPRK